MAHPLDYGDEHRNRAESSTRPDAEQTPRGPEQKSELETGINA